MNLTCVSAQHKHYSISQFPNKLARKPSALRAELNKHPLSVNY